MNARAAFITNLLCKFDYAQRDAQECGKMKKITEITFEKKNDNISCVHYQNCVKTYPLHTHTKHLVIGMVEGGKVFVSINGEKNIYGRGEQFSVFPNVAHEIRAVNGEPYTMSVLCVQAETEITDRYLKFLWEYMIENPENRLLLDDMAEMINVSKYHLIRQFKQAFGLTPHQFQIQCRVRKAQKLLEVKRTTEVSYDSGFCDESHFDRCFQKLVQLTPTEYVSAIENDH